MVPEHDTAALISLVSVDLVTLEDAPPSGVDATPVISHIAPDHVAVDVGARDILQHHAAALSGLVTLDGVVFDDAVSRRIDAATQLGGVLGDEVAPGSHPSTG